MSCPLSPTDAPVAVIGAGPAGLTAAHALGCRGLPAVVYEAGDSVGGISRTEQRNGWRFDIGGHRFFTKAAAVSDFWHRILSPEDFLRRPRMSRIYFQGKLYDYPLKPLNALRNLGPIEAVRCVASYLAVRVRPPRDQSNFEGWVAARFGWRLYRTFFKTYTEKVWGVPATAIQADWAAQRIKNLSLFTAVLHALRPGRPSTAVTSLIEEFDYPKYGPGMLWERTRDQVQDMGIDVRMRTPIDRIEHRDGLATHVHVAAGGSTSVTEQPVSAVISSMPLGDLVRSLDPPAPAAVLAAADGLRYRDFLTVALVVPQEYSFPDNWIYIHDPAVSVGRIQNFGSWSPYLVKDGRTCLGLEYFVTEDDGVWSRPDHELIALVTDELDQLSLVPSAAVQEGYVVRQGKAYPVYDADYRGHVDTIRSWLTATVANVHPVGRNGMHRYNNADHSMLTALLTVDNLAGHVPAHDIWAVNVDDDYHEETTADAGGAADRQRQGTGRDAPTLPTQRRPADLPLSA